MFCIYKADNENIGLVQYFYCLLFYMPILAIINNQQKGGNHGEHLWMVTLSWPNL
jgi:hypothetical protein